MPMDKAKFQAAIDEMKANNSELVDGLYVAIERLAMGNPRLLKKERKLFASFFLTVIEQMTLNTQVASKLNEIREVIDETSSHKERVVDLYEERAALTLETYKVLQRYLRDGETILALNMLHELIGKLES